MWGVSNYGWNGFIADNFEEFASKSVLLYQDEMIWNQSQKNGFEILKTRFKIDLFEYIFADKVNVIKSDLENHRKQNFMGSLFLYKKLENIA